MSARVVPRPFDSDCAIGICSHGCSHLMWACDECGSEGGWGARDEKLRTLAAAHVCHSPSARPIEEIVAEALYPHMWNGRACACGWNMWEHPRMWHEHAAAAVVAALSAPSEESER